LKIHLDNTIVEGLPLVQGKELDVNIISKFIDGKVTYASWLPGTLYIYGNVKSYSIDELKKLGFEKIKIYAEGFEKGVYCGVTDEQGNDYPCIIEKINFERREILLKTTYTGVIKTLKTSRIRLKEDYTEEYIEV